MSDGFRNMLHFVGVVEDAHDKTNSGRVRVRAFGIHPPRDSQDEQDSVPTDHLPWATVLDGTYGVAPVVPSVGDWVFGFFIDGSEAQQPMIMGRLPGMQLSFASGSGQEGEDGYIAPESVHNFGAPPLHRYNSGEEMTVGQTLTQRALQESGIPQALSEETFDEPSIYSPENNLINRVIKSKNGDNFIVIGDAEDGENSDYILMSHSSGSVFQIDANGTIFVKSFADQYNTTDGVLSTFVTGSSHTNIQEDYTLKVEHGSGKIFINGDLDVECENFNVTARTNINLTAGVKTNVSAAGISVLATDDDINIVSVGSTKMKAGNAKNKSGFYLETLNGDFHLDTYKTNMFSEAYTKITSKGTPAVSDQLLPYADAGHKGIEINTSDSIHIESTKNASIKAGGVFSVNATGDASIKSAAKFHASANTSARMSANNTAVNALSGQADMTATGTANIQSSGTASVDGSTVQLGNGTSASSPPDTASATITTQESARAVQISFKDARESVTEKASVVAPEFIPGSRAVREAIIKRLRPIFTSLMSSGDD